MGERIGALATDLATIANYWVDLEHRISE